MLAEQLAAHQEKRRNEVSQLLSEDELMETWILTATASHKPHLNLMETGSNDAKV